jgi:hypothetical protein
MTAPPPERIPTSEPENRCQKSLIDQGKATLKGDVDTHESSAATFTIRYCWQNYNSTAKSSLPEMQLLQRARQDNRILSDMHVGKESGDYPGELLRQNYLAEEKLQARWCSMA